MATLPKPAILAAFLLMLGCNRSDRSESQHAPHQSPQAAAPATAPAVTDSTDAPSEADAAVSAARRFARAIADGDAKTAQDLLYAPTPSHVRLAAAVVRQFMAYHRVRVAAIKRIGEAEAKRLPMNDAGALFTDRMNARLMGDRGEVAWRDDYGQSNTERELEMIKSDGQWRVSMRSFIGGASEEDETISDVLEAVGDVSWYTRELEKAANDIESGKLMTFKEINDAT